MEGITTNKRVNNNPETRPAGAPSADPAGASISAGANTRADYQQERSALESLTPEERKRWDEIMNSDGGPAEKIAAINQLLEKRTAGSQTSPQSPQPSGVAGPEEAQSPSTEPDEGRESFMEAELEQPVAPQNDPAILRYRQLAQARKDFYGGDSAEKGSDASKHTYDRCTRGKFRQRAALDEEHYRVRLAKELELSKQMLKELGEAEGRLKDNPEMLRAIAEARKDIHKNLRKAYNDYTFAAKVQVDFETPLLSKRRVEADRNLARVNKVLKAAIADPERADTGALLESLPQLAAA